jgi:hypothetical protein
MCGGGRESTAVKEGMHSQILDWHPVVWIARSNIDTPLPPPPSSTCNVTLVGIGYWIWPQNGVVGKTNARERSIEIGVGEREEEGSPDVLKEASFRDHAAAFSTISKFRDCPKKLALPLQ